MESIFVLSKLLNDEQLGRVHELLATQSFEDGALSASGMAKSVKHNEQVPVEKLGDLLPILNESVFSQGAFKSLTMPRAITNVMVNRYREGMSYGTHTDAAIMKSGHRADISFTLFLSRPENYEGGALVFQTAFGERELRLEAGSMIVYPTGVLHRVSEVTRGERLAIIGWIQSRVRDPQKRQILLDLERARKSYLKQVGHDGTADLLLKSSQNLRRMWDE